MKTFFYFLASFALVSADFFQLDQFSSGNQAFTQQVYDQLLVDNTKNILVSPFSAEALLALIQSGAKGATGEEIRNSLHFPSSKEATDEAFKSILPTIRSDHVSLNTANKIYVAENFPINEEYKKVAEEAYFADLENVNFVESAEAAQTINQWVAKETNNKIKEIVTSDDLNSLTRLVLVNTLYFKGDWAKPFDPTFTREDVFYTSEKSTVQASMMLLPIDIYNYYESEELDAKILEKPFVGGEAAVTFILPNKREGIAVLEKNIRAVLAKPNYTQELIELKMPRFKIENSVNFTGILQKLGVHKVFKNGEADLSGISGLKGRLFVDYIKQKTFIAVNEVGVEAAAATGGGIVSGVRPSIKFIADHPFMFYITFKDIILFGGRVLRPEYN